MVNNELDSKEPVIITVQLTKYLRGDTGHIEIPGGGHLATRSVMDN